jgi:hypothetical protein
MKGPEAKALYGQVLDELGKGLPGGRDKVKGAVPFYDGLALTDRRWCIRRNDAG